MKCGVFLPKGFEENVILTNATRRMNEVSQCDMIQQFERGRSLSREQTSTSVALCDGDGWRSVAVGMTHQHHPLQPQ